MHTVTIEITDSSGLRALHRLEARQKIRIVEPENFTSPSLPGNPLSMEAFKTWIQESENTPCITLTAAKEKWAIKRKQLQKLIK